MDVGEAVGIAIIIPDNGECPFDHSPGEPPTVKNDLIGVGTTLGTRMKGGKSTAFDGPRKKPDGEQVQNPKNVEGHPFKNKAKCVTIYDNDGTTTFQHDYPVVCAAHHLIPAQESLKLSRLLAFMVNKKEAEPLKDGSYGDGQVWSDLGYDVNGAENGVYLPGSYAVGGGRGGMGVWDSTSDGDDDDAEPGDSLPDPASNQLTGSAGQISKTNRKWMYVRQAMRLAPGQFHDRHVDYSNHVQGMLNKIFDEYVISVQKSFGDTKCSQCKDKADKIADMGVPTPYGLLDQLNGLSIRLKALLNGATWWATVYTSKWGKNYMAEKIAGNPAATLMGELQ